jgi:hypothetical protein
MTGRSRSKGAQEGTYKQRRPAPKMLFRSSPIVLDPVRSLVEGRLQRKPSRQGRYKSTTRFKHDNPSAAGRADMSKGQPPHPPPSQTDRQLSTTDMDPTVNQGSESPSHSSPSGFNTGDLSPGWVSQMTGLSVEPPEDVAVFPAEFSYAPMEMARIGSQDSQTPSQSSGTFVNSSPAGPSRALNRRAAGRARRVTKSRCTADMAPEALDKKRSNDRVAQHKKRAVDKANAILVNKLRPE